MTELSKADAALAYDLGVHAAQRGFQSMATVWETIPRHLLVQAMAVSLAYLQHKINGATSPAMTDGNPFFGKQVETMTAIFDQDLAEQVKRAGRKI